jgi:hypothetical protein
MNERFAAEPATCDSAFELKHLLEKFGPTTGRYLAAYPAQGWEKLLYGHIAEWSDLEQEKAKIVIRRAKETRALVRRIDVPYEERETWLQNIARAQIAQLKFDGVVVSRSSAGVFPSLEDLDLPPTTAERVPAKATEYVRVSRTLLMASAEIHFVDPYLDPCDRDREVVLQEMLRAAVTGRCQSVYIWVRDDRLKRSIAEAAKLLGRIARSVGFVNPRRLHLHAFSDAGRSIKVHDRYLLSLYGAIRFEHGFQQLTGKRTAAVSPESRQSHDELVSLFLNGENDLGIESLMIDLS